MYTGRLRVVLDRHAIWIDELITLLDAVVEEGSISGAARASGIGYRRAWQILHDAAKLFGVALAESKTGGNHGGGTLATADADRIRRKLTTLNSMMEGELRGLVAGERQDCGAADHNDSGLSRTADVLLATSLEPVESGVLPRLEQLCEAETGIRVRHIPAGSGEALAMLVAHRVDLALSHAPRIEARLLRDGRLGTRIPFMESRFVVALGADDPAGLLSHRGTDLSALFALIAEKRAPFVSRGDGSGTHARELEIWSSLDVEPVDGTWYRRSPLTGSTGSVTAAVAEGGYTLADEGITLRMGVSAAVPEPDERSRNVYALLSTDSADGGSVAVRRFIAWISGSCAADAIRLAGLQPL